MSLSQCSCCFADLLMLEITHQAAGTLGCRASATSSWETPPPAGQREGSGLRTRVMQGLDPGYNTRHPIPHCPRAGRRGREQCFGCALYPIIFEPVRYLGGEVHATRQGGGRALPPFCCSGVSDTSRLGDWGAAISASVRCCAFPALGHCSGCCEILHTTP